MITDKQLDVLVPIIIKSYTKEYAKIGKIISPEYWNDYFDPYFYYFLVGNSQSFIIYQKWYHMCFIIDAISTNGKMYEVFSELCKTFDIMLAWAYESLPIVTRSYKKLGFLPLSCWNKDGQRLFARGL